MAHDWHSPLDAIFHVVASTVGWAFSLPLLVYAGIAIGCAMRHSENCFGDSLGWIAWLPLLWIASPILLPAYIVTLIAYIWPLYSESTSAYLIAGTMTFAVWTLASIFNFGISW